MFSLWLGYGKQHNLCEYFKKNMLCTSSLATKNYDEKISNVGYKRFDILVIQLNWP